MGPRRDDITRMDRGLIAIEVMSNDRPYGRISELAQTYQVSRQTIYVPASDSFGTQEKLRLVMHSINIKAQDDDSLPIMRGDLISEGAQRICAPSDRINGCLTMSSTWLSQETRQGRCHALWARKWRCLALMGEPIYGSRCVAPDGLSDLVKAVMGSKLTLVKILALC